jgi:hypothetical protein
MYCILRCICDSVHNSECIVYNSVYNSECIQHEIVPPCRKDRHAAGDEEAEDEELLKDEDDDEATAGRGHRLQVQPSVIVNGLMREYQIQGLNWLVHLYDNGINGILADEMVRFSCFLHSDVSRVTP